MRTRPSFLRHLFITPLAISFISAAPMSSAGSAPSSTQDIKARLLEVIPRDRGVTFSEIVAALGWEGDRRPLRKALAELVREGRVLRVPDYERKRMTFRRPQASP